MQLVFPAGFSWPWAQSWLRALIHSHALLMCIAANALIAGCSSSIRVTDPPRSATEQFLVSTAAAEAVAQLAIEPLRGRSVYVDPQYFAASEQPFVIGELRSRLLLGGVQLTNSRTSAQVVMEVRSGGVGIDRADKFIGIPPVLLNSSAISTADGVPLATPELSVLKNVDQRGIASVAYVAYWRETGEIIAASGPYVGYTRREDWWYFGLGTGTVGDIPPTDFPLD